MNMYEDEDARLLLCFFFHIDANRCDGRGVRVTTEGDCLDDEIGFQVNAMHG